MTINTHWWFRDIPHSPFGLVWDVPEPPARIYGHPKSSAGFPLIPGYVLDHYLNVCLGLIDHEVELTSEIPLGIPYYSSY